VRPQREEVDSDVYLSRAAAADALGNRSRRPAVGAQATAEDLDVDQRRVRTEVDARQTLRHRDCRRDDEKSDDFQSDLIGGDRFGASKSRRVQNESPWLLVAGVDPLNRFVRRVDYISIFCPENEKSILSGDCSGALAWSFC
jgi:hypothetical protein